ncbi:MAG: PAS domain S-box protein, partial [Polaromonas sp.]|nr:PAS domain S-box protein [Polaromonas sp.]
MTTETRLADPPAQVAVLAQVLESFIDAAVTVNARQAIVLFNPAAEKMFGWTRQAVLGESIEKLLPGRFRPAHGGQVAQFGATGATLRRNGKLAATVYALRPDGTEFPVDVSISQLDTPEGKLFTAIVRDLTDEQAAQAQLRLLDASI